MINQTVYGLEFSTASFDELSNAFHQMEGAISWFGGRVIRPSSSDSHYSGSILLGDLIEKVISVVHEQFQYDSDLREKGQLLFYQIDQLILQTDEDFEKCGIFYRILVYVMDAFFYDSSKDRWIGDSGYHSHFLHYTEKAFLEAFEYHPINDLVSYKGQELYYYRKD